MRCVRRNFSSNILGSSTIAVGHARPGDSAKKRRIRRWDRPEFQALMARNEGQRLRSVKHGPTAMKDSELESELESELDLDVMGAGGGSDFHQDNHNEGLFSKQLYNWIKDRPQEFERIKESLTGIREKSEALVLQEGLKSSRENFGMLFAGDEDALDDGNSSLRSILFEPSRSRPLLSSSANGTSTGSLILTPILKDIIDDPASLQGFQKSISEFFHIVRSIRKARMEKSSASTYLSVMRHKLYMDVAQDADANDKQSLVDYLTPQKMWNFMVKMRDELKIPPSIECINHLMAQCIDQKDFNIADKCYKTLLSSGLSINEDTFLQILRKSIVKRELDSFESGLKMMKSLNIPVTNEFALEILKEMMNSVVKADGSIQASRKNALGDSSSIYRISKNSWDKEKKNEMLVEAVPAMEQSPHMAIHRVFYNLRESLQKNRSNFRKVFLSEPCYEIVMEACAAQYMAERCLRYYREFLKAGYVPTKRIFLSLLKCLSERPEFFKEFWMIVKQAESEGHCDNLSQYDANENDDDDKNVSLALSQQQSSKLAFSRKVIEYACHASGKVGNISCNLTLLHGASKLSLLAKEPCIGSYSVYMYRNLFKSIFHSQAHEKVKLDELRERWERVYKIEKDLSKHYFDEAREKTQFRPWKKKEKESEDDKEESFAKNREEENEENRDEETVSSGEIRLKLPHVRKLLASDFLPGDKVNCMIERYWGKRGQKEAERRAKEEMLESSSEMIGRKFGGKKGRGQLRKKGRSDRDTPFYVDRLERTKKGAMRRIYQLSSLKQSKADNSVDKIVTLNPRIRLPPILRTLEDGRRVKVHYKEIRCDPMIRDYHRKVLREEAERLDSFCHEEERRNTLIKALKRENRELSAASTHFDPETFLAKFESVEQGEGEGVASVKLLNLVTNDELAAFDSWDQVMERVKLPSAEDKVALATELWTKFQAEGNTVNSTVLDEYFSVISVFAGDTSRVRRFMKEEYVGKRRLVPTARTFALAASRAARSPQTSLEWAKELYAEFESFCNNQRADPGDKHRTKFYTDIVNIYAANDLLSEAKAIIDHAARKGCILRSDYVGRFVEKWKEEHPQFSGFQYEKGNLDLHRLAKQLSNPKDADADAKEPPYMLPLVVPHAKDARWSGTGESKRRSSRVLELLQKVYGPVLTTGHRQFLPNNQAPNKYGEAGAVEPDSSDVVRCYRTMPRN